MIVVISKTLDAAESIINLYPDKQGEDRESSLKNFRKHFKQSQRGDRRLYLLKDGKKTVGTVSLVLNEEDPDEPQLYGEGVGHINHLRIHPDYQGNKLAGLLNSRLEDDARSMGLKALILGVEPDNQKAIDIYTHWGYERFLEYEGDAGHGKTQTIIGMRKDL